MGSPQVSVLVVAHDDLAGPTEAIKLAEQQTNVETEVCVVGTTGSKATVDDLRARFASMSNLVVSDHLVDGVGPALNVAMSLASAEYACHLPVNLRCEVDALAVLLSPLLSESTLATSQGSVQIVDSDGSYVARRYQIARHSRYLVQAGTIAHPLRLFRTSSWSQTTGYDPLLKIAADYDMFLKLGEVGDFFFNRHQLSKVVIAPSEYSSIDRGFAYEDHMRAVRSGLLRRAGDSACMSGSEGNRLATGSSRISITFPDEQAEHVAALTQLCPQWQFRRGAGEPGELNLQSPVLSTSRAKRWAGYLESSLVARGAHVGLMA